MTKTKWYSKILSLSIVFSLVFSLVAMVVPVAAADESTLTVELSTENATYCCCDTYNVTATISCTGGEQAENVTATLTLANEVEFVYDTSATSNTTPEFDVDNGSSTTVNWLVHCTGDGDADFDVEVVGDNTNTPSDFLTVSQLSGDLAAHIVTPTSTALIPVCSEFDLTFYIENTGCNNVIHFCGCMDSWWS